MCVHVLPARPVPATAKLRHAGHALQDSDETYITATAFVRSDCVVPLVPQAPALPGALGRRRLDTSSSACSPERTRAAPHTQCSAMHLRRHLVVL